MAELAIRPDGTTVVVPDGYVGQQEGNAAQLARTLGLHPHVLAGALQSGRVPSEFLGQGRYRIGGDVMRRGLDSGGNLLPDEDAEPDTSSHVSPRDSTSHSYPVPADPNWSPPGA